MTWKRKARNLWRSMLVVSASGMLLGVSCTDQQLQALSIGINAVASALTDNRQDNNPTFGEWLLGELDDL